MRLFDIYNCFIGATQIAGIDSCEWNEGHRPLVAPESDGGPGTPSYDTGPYYADMRLSGADIATFPALLALFEASGAAAGLTVLAEGKKSGTATGSKLTANRMKLIGASLDFQQGGVARTTFDLKNSAADASTSEDDELALADVASPAITHSSALRGARIMGAAFTPSGGSAITPLGMAGMSLNVRFANDEVYGDDDFGVTVEVGAWSVDGSIRFADTTLASSKTMKQQLIAAVRGVLVVTYQPQGGAANKTLTINNLRFAAGRTGLRTGKHHDNAINFGCDSQNGANWYTLGTGTYKLLAVA